MNIIDLSKLVIGLKLLWEKIKKDRMYLVQLIGAVLLVAINYLAGPFLADELLIGIGAALVVPEPLWRLMVVLAKKLGEQIKRKV